MVLAMVIPYTYRENDDASTRRLLWKQFLDRSDLPSELRGDEDVIIKEGYWTNRRGMALMRSTIMPRGNNDNDDNDANINDGDGGDGGGIRAVAVVCLCHGC